MMTLEMPTEEPTFSVDFENGIVSFNTAAQAADLLERGEAEGEVESVEFPDCKADAVDVAASPHAESNGKPAKKKRGRKAKAAREVPPGDCSELGKDHPLDTNAPTGEAPATAEVWPNDKPVPSPPPKPEPTEHDKRITEQLARVEMSRSTRSMEISNTERRCIECFMAIAETEAVIESQKDQLKHLREIHAALAVELRDLRRGDTWQPKLPIVAEQVASYDGPATTEAPPVVATTTPPIPTNFYPDAWRSASIDELRLPSKLAETLASANAETIGHLEDLRAEISQGRAKWPKGIGAAKITLIEDAVIKWLTANRDRQVFEQTQPAGTQAAISAGDPTPMAQPESESPSRRPAAVSSASGGEPSLDTTATAEPSDAEADATIIARAKLLNDGTTNCLAVHHPAGSKHYDSGYQAYGRVVDGEVARITDCPITPGAERDDWLRGFMAAEKVDNYEPAESSPAETETAATTSPAPELVSIDDL